MRSPYAVLPDPRRPIRFGREEVEVGFKLGGRDGLRVVLCDLLWLRIRGRATSPAEAGLLREWLAAEVEDQTAYWTERLSGPEVPEVEP